jgi:hypothetical protein
MAQRVLSGILLASTTKGRATVRFCPHDVEGDARGVCQVEIGPEGPFRAPPARILGLRETCPDSRSCKIDEHAHTEAVLELSWDGAKEIAYLVIGEVAD